MVIRRINPSTSELYHHGVKGQQWGKRNGPPYPLDASVSTGKQLKKAQKKVSKDIKRITRLSKDSNEAIEKINNYVKENTNEERINEIKSKADVLKKEYDAIFTKDVVKNLYNDAEKKAKSKIGNIKDYDDEEEYYIDLVTEADDYFLDNIEKHLKTNAKQYNKALNDYSESIKNLTNDLVGDKSNSLLQTRDTHYLQDPNNRQRAYKGQDAVANALNTIGNTPTSWNSRCNSVILNLEDLYRKAAS